MTIKKWQTLEQKEVARTPVFGLDAVLRQPPFDAKPANFYVVDLPDWINIFAYTADEQIVLIRQYRHGTDSITVEVPGGAVDPGEAHLEAAQRELYEETGYRAKSWHEVGVVEVNPAIQNNSCYTFVALDAYKAGDPEPDEYEEIAVELHPSKSVAGMIADGEITHSLVAAGLLHVHRFLRNRAG